MLRSTLLFIAATLVSAAWPVFAQIPPSRPPRITSVTPTGVGYTTVVNSTNGISADLGRWDTPYPGGPNGPSAPGLEPSGSSMLAIAIDVNDGGQVSFDYSLRTWDAGRYDWYNISVVTPTGTVSLVNRLGKPGDDYGTYFQSPRIPISVSLNPWRNLQVTFLFSVRHDGWGDQTQGQLFGFSIRTCPVAPLAPLTDADALRFENGDTVNIEGLQPDMREALGCLRTAAAADRGTLTVTSAYRPPTYQEHLREVWDKWRLLRDMRNAECDELRTQVRNEFTRHGLLSSQRPATANGRHTQGAAIDMVSTLPTARFLALANRCHLVRPLPEADPVHFIHQ